MEHQIAESREVDSQEVVPHEALEASQPESGSDGVKLLDLVVVLVRGKRVLIRCTLGFALAAAVISLLMPSYYRATAVLMPPQQNQPGNATLLLGQIGMFAGLSARDLGLRNPSDIHAAVLKSRSVSDSLIRRFDLQKVYGARRLADAQAELEDSTRIQMKPEGVISIAVDDKDPKRAADLANGYVEELDSLNQKLAISEASRRRVFFESQMAKVKDELSEAEAALRKTQETTGVLEVGAQTRAVIESVANIRAQITLREVELYRLQASATEQNPDVVRLRRELKALRQQLTQAERTEVARSGAQPSTQGMPQAGLEYVRRLREVKYQEAVYEFVSKQLEAARLDEAHNVSLVQVLDRAVVPEVRSSPHRMAITLIGAFLGFFTAVAFLLVREVWQAKQEDPAIAARIQEIRTEFFRK